MSTKVNELMSAARMQLIRDHPFWATVLLSLPVMEREDIPIMATDGYRLYYNPEGVKTLGSVDNIKFVFCHEVMHIIMTHMERGLSKLHKIWNISADLVSNMILHENHIQWNNNTTNVRLVDDSVLSGRKERGVELTAEMAYDILVKNAKFQCTCGSGDGEGSACGDKHQRGGKGQGGGQCPVHGDDQRGFDTHMYRPLEDHEKTMVKHAIVKGFQVAKQTQGKLPAGLDRYIKELLEPEVNWRVKLKKLMESKVRGYAVTNLYPSKKSHAIGYFMPQTRGYALSTLAAAVDTSGSISNEMLRRFASEVMEVSSLVKKTMLMSCDAEVHEYVEVNRLNCWTILDKFRFKGGGGTDFRPVFRKIEKDRLNPKVLVYLTDSYGTFPRKAPGYPVIWVVVGGSPDVKIPFGEVIHVNE